MSPEKAVGEEVDGRSDLYSLGCVLYEMLVGEPPFTGPTVQAVIAKRFVQTPTDVAALREGVPRAVARTLQQVLARVTVDRHETSALFVSALNERDAATATPVAPAQSLAILPFENLSADPDNQYLADGIADDILDALVQIDELHVAARASAFSFRGKQNALAEIGSALNVATVLQGSLRRSGNRMRLAVQLISVHDGYHLWSERFDRELVDVFAVQDEIAVAIAERLRVTFVAPDTPAGKATTAEVEAFELVAKGRALLAMRGASLLEARACLERAIELDPHNADAHAVLGETLRNFVTYGLMPVAEGRPLAKAALARSLELAPDFATAMGALGNVSLNLDHDPEAAFGWWERALALQPRLSEVRALYAMNGLILLRHDIDRGIGAGPCGPRRPAWPVLRLHQQHRTRGGRTVRGRGRGSGARLRIGSYCVLAAVLAGDHTRMGRRRGRGTRHRETGALDHRPESMGADRRAESVCAAWRTGAGRGGIRRTAGAGADRGGAAFRALVRGRCARPHRRGQCVRHRIGRAMRQHRTVLDTRSVFQ